jgi:hypothetical protein
LLRLLLVRIGSYPKSVLRYQFLILHTYHPDILYVHEQWCEDPWLFFEALRGLRSKQICEKQGYFTGTLRMLFWNYFRPKPLSWQDFWPQI